MTVQMCYVLLVFSGKHLLCTCLSEPVESREESLPRRILYWKSSKVVRAYGLPRRALTEPGASVLYRRPGGAHAGARPWL